MSKKQLGDFEVRLLRYIAQDVGLTKHHASGVTRAFIVSVGRIALNHFRELDAVNPDVVVWDDKEIAIGGQADPRHRSLTGDRLRAYQRAAYFVRRFGSKIRHVLDWLEVAVREGHAWLEHVDEHGRPRKLMKCGSILALFNEAEKQLRIVAQRQAAQVDTQFALTSTDIKWIASIGDDLHIVQLLSAAALDEESARMGHCIGLGGYDDRVEGDQRRWSYWSVRNSDGYPLATLEVREGVVRQLSGRGNRAPPRSLRKAVEKYMETVDWTYPVYKEIDVEAYHRRIGLQTDFWRLERRLGRKPTLDDIRRFNRLPVDDKIIIVARLRELAGYGPDDPVPRLHEPERDPMHGVDVVELPLDDLVDIEHEDFEPPEPPGPR